MESKAPQLFELSWEVCNKVGGIHTVIRSKLPSVLANFGENYLAIGPYGERQDEFQPLPLPTNLKGIAAALEKRGITIHYGKWLVDGEPSALLVDFQNMIPELNRYKGHFWDRYHLDTLGSDFYDLDKPLFWSVAVGMFIEEYAKVHHRPVIVQVHEWMSAGALLHLNEAANPHICSVFTTHATVLGRALSAGDEWNPEKLRGQNMDDIARRHGVLAKHQLERLGAELASVFTTVSRLTADEAELVLGKKAQTIVENGLDTEQLPSYDQLSLEHRHVRERLDAFTAAYFFPSYRFDLEKTTYQYSMGRYEIHNKGYDLYLEALGDLNRALQEEKSDRTVVSFLLIAGNPGELRAETVQRMAAYEQATALLEEERSRSRDFAAATAGKERTFSPHVIEEVGRLISRLIPDATPNVSPHFHSYHEIEELCAGAGLMNREEDRVKVIFLPLFFEGFDGLFNLSLYRLITGFDLGVFPSLYEPWGYTPLESLALGVPAVTSTATGFGQSAATQPSLTPPGILVLDRRPQGGDSSRADLLQLLRSLENDTPRKKSLRRLNAYLSAQPFGWDRLYENYRTAYSTALTKRIPPA